MKNVDELYAHKKKQSVLLILILFISITLNIVSFINPDILPHLRANSPTIDNNNNIELVEEKTKEQELNTSQPIVKNIEEETQILDNKSSIEENLLEIIEVPEEISENNILELEEKSPLTEEDIKETLAENIILTPEQYLAMSLRKEIDKITEKSKIDLISDIQIILKNRTMIITVKDNWNSLTESQQQTTIETIFNQMKYFNFGNFKVINNQHELLARNAFVGDSFIIMER